MSTATDPNVAEFVDTADNEDTHYVFINPGPVSEDGETMSPSICLDWKIDMSVGQARAIAAELMMLANRLTPASPAALDALTVPLDAINNARGTSHTTQSVAESLGIDLETATGADVTRIAHHIGGVLMA